MRRTPDLRLEAKYIYRRTVKKRLLVTINLMNQYNDRTYVEVDMGSSVKSKW